MSHPFHREEQNSENKTTLADYAAAITNILSWSNGKAKLLQWDRLSLDALAGCFEGVPKANVLSIKSLQPTLLAFQENTGRLRQAIPKGTRIHTVVTPCSDEGLLLAKESFNDDKNDNSPYFRLLYSVPNNPSGLALGHGNVKPAPLLPLFPEEIITQCYFDVNWPEFQDYDDLPYSSPNGPRIKIDQDEKDYQYLALSLTSKFQRLQELIRGRLK